MVVDSRGHLIPKPNWFQSPEEIFRLLRVGGKCGYGVSFQDNLLRSFLGIVRPIQLVIPIETAVEKQDRPERRLQSSVTHQQADLV